MSPPRLALGLALAAVATLAAVAGLMVVGGPGTARLERLDERRARDLKGLAQWLEHHREQEGRLPETLGALEPMLPGEVSALDPATGAPYVYERLGENDFRLCAELALPEKQEPEVTPLRPYREGRLIRRLSDPGGRTLCLETVTDDR